MKVLILVGEEFEDLEAFYPYYRLKEEGIKPIVAWKAKGRVKGKMGYEIKADLSFDEVRPEEYVGLILPGGKGPERIRTIPKVIEIVKAFEAKPIAAICHGPQLLISAGLLKGKRATCYPGIRDDVRLAGAKYVDEPVVVDGNLITSRIPADLPYMMKEFIALLKSL